MQLPQCCTEPMLGGNEDDDIGEVVGVTEVVLYHATVAPEKEGALATPNFRSKEGALATPNLRSNELIDPTEIVLHRNRLRLVETVGAMS